MRQVDHASFISDDRVVWSKLSKALFAVVAIVVGGLVVFGGRDSPELNDAMSGLSKEVLRLNPEHLVKTLTAEIPMQITSSVFLHNAAIPSKYTCDGVNVSPPLEISGVPEEAKSLALIMDDPDAPQGTWVHWTVWNITSYTKEIPENGIPNLAPWDPNSPAIPLPAVEGVTSFGKPGYGGPCPHSGTHRYFFKLYALDITIDLPPSAKKEDAERAMEGHILASAELVGLYSRETK